MALEIQDTVNQNMASAVSLLHPIATMNKSRDLQRVYFEPERGIALAGFRRQVADYGVVLARAKYGKDNEVKLDRRRFYNRTGFFDYVDQEYYEESGGLRGTMVKENEYELYDSVQAAQTIADIRDRAAGRYEVHLSPNDIYKFFKKNRKRTSSDLRDRKLNMQFTAGVPKGLFIGVSEFVNGEFMVHVELRVKGERKKFPGYVDRDSTMPIEKLEPGCFYLVKPGKYDRETGIRTYDIQGRYKSGIQMAVQHFNAGLMRPGDKGYGVNPDPQNGINSSSVLFHPFMSLQDRTKITNAPMMVFDYDFMYNIMYMLKGYPAVKMRFRDKTSGVYFLAEGNEYDPDIEIIAGPTIQYVKGRIWLP